MQHQFFLFILGFPPLKLGCNTSINQVFRKLSKFWTEVFFWIQLINTGCNTSINQVFRLRSFSEAHKLLQPVKMGGMFEIAICQRENDHSGAIVFYIESICSCTKLIG